MDLGKDRVGLLFASYFFPTLVGMFFSSIFIVADGIIVGRGTGAEGLATVNLISPLFTLSSGWGLMFGMGGSVLAAQALSRNRPVLARKIALLSFLSAVITAFVSIAVLSLFPKFTFNILAVPSELTASAAEYIYPIIGVILFNVTLNIGLFFIRLDGSPKYAMFCVASGSLLNIALDILFVFPLGMGLFGAALATLLAEAITVCMMAYYFMKKAGVFTFDTKFDLLKISILKDSNIFEIIKIGFPVFLGEISISFMTVISNRVFFDCYGTDGVAAFSVVCFILPILFMVYNAVIQSAQPIISYNFAVSQSRAFGCLKIAFNVCLLLGVVLTIVTLMCNNQIVSFFLDTSTHAYSLASNGIVLFAAGFIPIGLNILIVGWLQSVGNGVVSTWITIFRGIFLVWMCFRIFPPVFDSGSIWLCTPCAEMICLGILFLLRRRIFFPRCMGNLRNV